MQCDVWYRFYYEEVVEDSLKICVRISRAWNWEEIFARAD